MSAPAATPPAAADPRRRLVLQIIHTYTVILHVALPAILYVLYGDGNFALATPAWTLALADPPDPLVWGAMAAAAFALVLAQTVPRYIPKAGVPYIVKLCLTELCVVAGFVLGMLREAPELAVPFAVVGLALVLMMPPPRTE